MTDATQVNAQVSKGSRLGGINAPICSEADEELWNYEAGVKSTLLGGRGTFNASAFYMDIRNLQGDPHGRHLLVAHHLQRARRAQRRRRSGAGRTAVKRHVNTDPYVQLDIRVSVTCRLIASGRVI